MATNQTFVDFATPVPADWLNNVNTAVNTYIVGVQQYGAVGNGTHDDTIAIQSALAIVSAGGGGVVHIPYGLTCLITSNTTIPSNVVLTGGGIIKGNPGNNSSAPYLSQGGAIILSTSATITLSSSAAITGLLIRPAGMTFPQTDSSTWTGTALTITGDDSTVSGCLVIGFNAAVVATGAQRPKVFDLLFDCNNGVEVTNCLDIAQIHRCHGWPYANIALASKPSNWSDRSGIAYNIHDTVDWANIVDCFAYNYTYGGITNNVAQTSWVNFKTDGPFTVSAGTGRTGTTGLLVEGTSTSTRIINPQINSAQFSVVVNVPTTPGYSVRISGGHLLSSGNPTTGPYNGAGLFVISGHVTVGSTFHYHSNAIHVTNATSIVKVTNECYFDSVAQVILLDVPTNNVFLDNPTMGAGINPGQTIVVGSTLTPPVVSTAGSGIALPMNGHIFSVGTQSSQFGDISGGWLGREITLQFTAAQTVFSFADGVVSHMRLANNTNFTTAAGTTLCLYHNGVQWYEKSRTA